MSSLSKCCLTEQHMCAVLFIKALFLLDQLKMSKKINMALLKQQSTPCMGKGE